MRTADLGERHGAVPVKERPCDELAQRLVLDGERQHGRWRHVAQRNNLVPVGRELPTRRRLGLVRAVRINVQHNVRLAHVRLGGRVAKGQRVNIERDRVQVI